MARLLLALLFGGIIGFGSKAEARKYGMAGCGLGSMVLGPSGSQVFAVTTNGSFGSQLFGITSGTSNCKPSKTVAAMMRQHDFLAVNMVTLQKELAQGGGATVAAFVGVLGCSEGAEQEAASILTSGYEEIFRAPGIEGVLDTAKDVLLQHKVTAAACKHLS